MIHSPVLVVEIYGNVYLREKHLGVTAPQAAVFSVDTYAEHPTNYHNTPTGAIGASGNGSIDIKGNASFVNNYSMGNAGENSPQIGRCNTAVLVALDEVDACASGFVLLLCWSNKRASIVNDNNGSGTNGETEYITTACREPFVRDMLLFFGVDNYNNF